MKIFLLVLGLSALFSIYIIQANAAIDMAETEGIWLFDDGAGDMAEDSSGNNRHGTIEGNAQWTKDGKFGGALELDGVDDEVVIIGYKGVGGNAPRTTVLWLRTTGPVNQRLVCWGANVNTNKYHIRVHDGPNTLRVETAGGQLYSTENPITDGEWHHLAVVLPEGSTMCHDHLLYVDGQLQENTGGTNIGVDTDVTQNDVEIGFDKVISQGVHVVGTIDEVAIFNVAMDEDEIRNIMLQGLSGSVLSVSSAGKLAIKWGELKQ